MAKKILLLTSTVSLMLSLFSCGKSSSDSPDTTIKNKIKNAQGLHIDLAVNDADSNPAPDTFKANCQSIKIKNETLYVEEKVQFNYDKKSYTYLGYTYSDKDCFNKLYTLTESGTFQFSTSGNMLFATINQATLTTHDSKLNDYFNQIQSCNRSNWVVGESQDINGTPCVDDQPIIINSLDKSDSVVEFIYCEDIQKPTAKNCYTIKHRKV